MTTIKSLDNMRFIAILLFLIAMRSTAAEITKSPNDDRSYRSLILDNQLQVLLISDPQTDRAAAALDIHVGSGNDPKNNEGMAHFLEHMLFLGTKKYPKAGEYQAFISKHGGSHNAYTSFQHTNYFFEVDAKHLLPALDRFSQQFISPLFNPEYVEREVKAVHSEFSAKLKDDYRRKSSAFREVLNQEHAYAQFSVGNLTTLANNANLHRDLLTFYQENYSSNLMKVVIYGKEPLNALEEQARTLFSQIPNNHLTAKKHSTPLFNESTLPSVLKVEPVMEVRSLELSFPMPSAQKYFREKPNYYLSNLIGHEGAGSLLSALKTEGLAEGLSAGAQVDTGEESLFSIKLSLTPKGIEQWKRIPPMLFAYIDKIQKQGIKEFYLNEQKAMLDLAFKYKQKSQPIHYVSGLASALHNIPTEKVLIAGYLLEPYSPTLYRQYLNHITAENMLITLVAKGVAHDKISKWYETPYSIETLKETQWVSSKDLSKKLTLPKKNEFIPDGASISPGTTMTQPVRLMKKEGLETWYAFDNEFADPKSSFYINIRSINANKTARHAVLTELLTTVVRDDLNEFSYPATLAGLSFSLYNHIRGISLKISGYPDKQSVLISKILNTLKTTPIKIDRLKQFKDDLRRSLENSKRRKPYEQVASNVRELLIAPLWNDEEKLAELSSITDIELNQFRKELLNELEIVTLAHGNITYAGALSLNQLVDTYLVSEAKTTRVPRGSLLSLNPNQLPIKELIFEHPDTGYIYYLQGKNRSFSERASFGLISQVLSSPYYSDIRTEKQLGYIVFATAYPMLEVPAMAFIVQSPNTDYQTIHHHTQEFLTSFDDVLKNMSTETFEQHQQSLINQILEKDKKLADRTSRYWQEIDKENENFDSKTKIAEEIKKLTLDTLVEQYSNILLERRELLVVKQGDNIDKDKPSIQKNTIKNTYNVANKDNLWKSKGPEFKTN